MPFHYTAPFLPIFGRGHQAMLGCGFNKYLRVLGTNLTFTLLSCVEPMDITAMYTSIHQASLTNCKFSKF